MVFKFLLKIPSRVLISLITVSGVDQSSLTILCLCMIFSRTGVPVNLLYVIIYLFNDACFLLLLVVYFGMVDIYLKYDLQEYFES